MDSYAKVKQRVGRVGSMVVPFLAYLDQKGVTGMTPAGGEEMSGRYLQ